MGPPSDASRLLSLPTELLAWIAVNCDNDELLNLRLSCRELAATSKDAFLQRFFSSRFTMIADPTSMRNLAQITRDPQICKKVKHLRFSLARLQDEDSDHDQRILEAGDRLQRSRAGRAQHKDFRLAHKRLSKEAQAYRNTSAIISGMSTIVQNLIDLKVEPPHISLVDSMLDYDTRDLPSAHGRLSKLLGYDQCLTADWGVAFKPFQAVLESLRDLQYPIKQLSLGAADHSVHVILLREPLCFTHLRQLRLSIRSDYTNLYLGDGVVSDHKAWVICVDDLLEGLVPAKRLESLTLAQGHWIPGGEFQNCLLGKLVQKAELHNDEFLPLLKVFNFNCFAGDVVLLRRFKQVKGAMLSDVTYRRASRVPGDAKKNDGEVLRV